MLFTPLKWKREGWMAKWRQDEDGSLRLERRTQRPVSPAPICGFEVSRSGELLAAVNPDGEAGGRDLQLLLLHPSRALFRAGGQQSSLSSSILPQGAKLCCCCCHASF